MKRRLSIGLWVCVGVLAGSLLTVPVRGQDLNTMLTYFISDLRSGTFSIGTGKDIIISSDGDGAVTFTANGNGSDEAITFNLDDTSNIMDITSSTGVATIRFASNSFSALSFSATSGFSSQNDGYVAWAGRSALRSPADGEVNALTAAETGLSVVRQRLLVEANADTKAPGALESNEWYTNTGDGDGSIINLPNDPTIGMTFGVAVTAAQTITINTGSGETIWLAGTDCSTDITGNDTGASLLIVAVTGGSGAIWHAIGSGTWSC